jgi:hypothetical protein
MNHTTLSGLTLLLSCTLLAGCASDKDALPKPTRCPQTAIIRDLSLLEDYGADTPDDSTRVATARLQKVEGGCSYDKKGVAVNFTVSLLTTKGPRLGGNQTSFPFFVAVVDQNDQPVTKELMTSSITFKDGERSIQKTEELRVRIPGSPQQVQDYRVLLGFQLTEEQLKLVRQNRPSK